MTNEEIIWIVVIALAALVLIGLIVAAMRKKSTESKRVQAQQLREEAHGSAAGLPDAHARAEQATTQAEHKRLEAERAEKEALRVRTELDQERARHENQIRAADRLDPDVNHRAKDYSPQVADPAGPSNIPSDPTLADPATGRATSTGSASDPDTILDHGDHGDHGDHADHAGATHADSTSSTESARSAELSDENEEPSKTAPRDESVGTDEDTLRGRLEGDSTPGAGSTTTAEADTDGTHRA